MQQLMGLEAAQLKEQLHGKLFYNPFTQEYEIAQKWLSGNVLLLK